MTFKRQEQSDDFIVNGRWHQCQKCGTNWSDSDGGCECMECDDCGERYLEDDEDATGSHCGQCVRNRIEAEKEGDDL